MIPITAAQDALEICSVGVLLVEGLQNVRGQDPLAQSRLALEASLRDDYALLSRAERKSLNPMDRYVAYYKAFGYSYHVLAQFESVIGGKPIAVAHPLVQAMFMAELKNMLLTAGHDFDCLQLPLRLMRATGTECYTVLGGREAVAVSGDLLIADNEGVISSILRGPDARTFISADTHRALYTVYAPWGVSREQLTQHLSDIESYARLAGATQCESFILESTPLTI